MMKLCIITFFALASLFSCSFGQKLKDGESAYERKQYAVAVTLLEEEFQNTKNIQSRARKSFLLGKSYVRLLEYEEAISWFEKAVELNYGAEAIGNLANTYRFTENYDLAVDNYKKLGQMTGRIQENDREILICKQAIKLKNNTSDYKIQKIFENSLVSDYAPVLYENDFLVFTSERKEATGSAVYNWSGEKFSDLFIVIKSGSDVKKFDSAINTSQNEGTSWFSKDYNTMYLTRCFSYGSGDEYCKLMVSSRENGIWSEAEVLPFVIDKINYGQPTLIENDSVLVFASDLSEPGGPSDLYYSELGVDGTWSYPEKLPSSINSQGNEKFPTGDNDTLYFSSDYLPGLGGYDIFKTFLRKDGSWSIPINIGYPINSGGDDFSFIVDYIQKKAAGVIQQGYFSSSRGSDNKDDIYKFTKINKPVETDKTTEIKEKPKSVFLTVKTVVNQYEMADNPNSNIIGTIPLGNAYIKVLEANGTKLMEGYTDLNGFYLTELPVDKALKIIGSKIEYLNASKDITTKNLLFKENENSITINVVLVLEKIYADKEINLKNIYYDYDKWDITEVAKPALNDLVVILNDNPQIDIQLSSHTDCRGTTEYNEDLSQKRAQSVVDYLIGKGINGQRLVAKGYGESQLVDNCLCESCTEDQHQANRRTTFKILKR
ncbi:MAG: OmpA family protein [Saprospiraceae bacterium]|nr:OmpA family protein [Saprospiraceae bacterium]